MFVQFLYFPSLVSLIFLKSVLRIQFNFPLVFKKKIKTPYKPTRYFYG